MRVDHYHSFICGVQAECALCVDGVAYREDLPCAIVTDVEHVTMVPICREDTLDRAVNGLTQSLAAADSRNDALARQNDLLRDELKRVCSQSEAMGLRLADAIRILSAPLPATKAPFAPGRVDRLDVIEHKF